METKKTKYDTNPLDPEYARKTEEVWSEGSPAETEELKGATRPVGPSQREEPRANLYSEAPTRRYDTPVDPQLDTPYQSVFRPPAAAPPVAANPTRAQIYQPPMPYGPSDMSRPVAGIGLPEKWAMLLPYVPFYIGVVPALLELLLVPRKEVKARFHAAQGLSLHLAFLAMQTILSMVATITDSFIGGTLFKAFATVFLIISMIRVYKGEPHRIAPLAEPSQWFNEHIEPRTSSR